MKYRRTALIGLPWADVNESMKQINVELYEMDVGQCRRHNQVLTLFQQSRTRELRGNEQLMISWCMAILFWAANDEAKTGYGLEHITQPLVDIFANLLNLDLGRLDGGVLSEWMFILMEPLGVRQ